MFPLDLALAVVLITGPADDNSGDCKPALSCPCPIGTVQALALSMELMDPREARYTLAHPDDFGPDLKVIRSRYKTLAFAPPLCDAGRFPGKELIADVLAFNRQYRQFLEDGMQLYPGREWDIGEAIREAEALYQVWDTARDAGQSYYWITYRRQSLLRLREMIGPQAYYAGLLPPPVPVWRFQRID